MKTLHQAAITALMIFGTLGGPPAFSDTQDHPFIEIEGQLCARDWVIIKMRDAEYRTGAKGRNELTARELGRVLRLPRGAYVREGGFDQWRRKQKYGPQASVNDIHLDATHLVVHLDQGMSVPVILDHLRKHPWIEYAEPDRVGFGGGAPSDPSYALQWHHEKINSTSAWAVTTGYTGVVVAVLDTGVNLAEAEFSGRLVQGYNFVSGHSNPSDDHGHGTAVAGVVGANANNARLVAGVDWACKIMPVKVLNSGNWGYYSWWANGVNYAVSNGAKVINLSAGGNDFDFTLFFAIENAVAHGVVFVTITHNDSVGIIRFPGTHYLSITVGATERNDTRAAFSNWGDEIDLVAPGQDIYTVGESGNLEHWWGTSFAAPQVAGVAALLAALRPSITQDEARALLCAGAEDQVGGASDAPGWDVYHGWGRLNAAYTLQLAETAAQQFKVSDTSEPSLVWAATANAPTRNPYRIQYSSDCLSWTTITNHQSIAYDGGNAHWTDDGSETGTPPADEPKRYYRVLMEP